ncbi:MAG: hypothetical protein U5K56_13885 [Halioglobus sp.]|nr:hypothetical protein [Halioglobus sp.]
MSDARAIYDHISTVGFGLLLLAALSLGSAARADKPNPYLMAENTWITISGTVESVEMDNFELDYGDGNVTVEMDDGDRDADGYKLMKGDKVTVSGVIDDDFYELTTIEASSVYVENLGTTFFASSVDEESLDSWAVAVAEPVIVSETVVQGTVTEVKDDEFSIDTGARKLEVDVDDMSYNPLDDEGYQKIGKGDRVRVTGDIDEDLFDSRELDADSVVKLNK